MTNYDYYERTTADILAFIRENINLTEFGDLDELEDRLNEECWVEDSITGNGSGSYTFDTCEARENLVGNWDLLADAVEELGADAAEVLREGPETADVLIRCYILPGCISAALDEIEEEFDAAHADDNSLEEELEQIIARHK